MLVGPFPTRSKIPLNFVSFLLLKTPNKLQTKQFINRELMQAYYTIKNPTSINNSYVEGKNNIK